MTILVIGGAGYIGSVLVSYLLAKGYRVVVLDTLSIGGAQLLSFWHHSNFRFIKGDVRSKYDVTASLTGVNAVVNLAAIVGEKACAAHPKVAQEINRDAAIHVGELARAKRVPHYVFISTCSNYGMSRSRGKATEETPLMPLSLYSETKVAAEKAILAEASATFSPTVVRLATVFGVSPRMRFDLILNEFVWAAYHKIPIVLYKPKAWRPLVHVSDVARAIETVLLADKKTISNTVFNIGYDNYRKEGMVRLIKDVFPTCVVKRQENGDDRNYMVSFEKAERVLDYKAKRSPEEGIAEIAQALRLGMFTKV